MPREWAISVVEDASVNDAKLRTNHSSLRSFCDELEALSDLSAFEAFGGFGWGGVVAAGIHSRHPRSKLVMIDSPFTFASRNLSPRAIRWILKDEVHTEEKEAVMSHHRWCLNALIGYGPLDPLIDVENTLVIVGADSRGDSDTCPTLCFPNVMHNDLLDEPSVTLIAGHVCEMLRTTTKPK